MTIGSCEHGVASNQVCQSCLDDFQANFHILKHEDHQEGMKFDDSKAPVMRGLIEYFPHALSEVSKVSGYGAQKYAWKNWVHVDDGLNRYSDALMRHVLAGAYESHDEESGLMHAAHAAWNALARLELLIKK